MHFSLGSLWRLKIIYLLCLAPSTCQWFDWNMDTLPGWLQKIHLIDSLMKFHPCKHACQRSKVPSFAACSRPAATSKHSNPAKIKQNRNVHSPVSSHRLLLSNLPVKAMASSKFKQMPKSQWSKWAAQKNDKRIRRTRRSAMQHAESNNWKNWVFYALRNEVQKWQKCANAPTLQAFALNRYNDCTCSDKLPLCAAWSKSDVTFNGNFTEGYLLKLALPAAAYRDSESLPASLHPSPAPMAPISTMAICDYIWRFVASHVEVHDKTNNCAFLKAFLYVAWCISPLDLADAVSFLQPASIGLT